MFKKLSSLITSLPILNYISIEDERLKLVIYVVVILILLGFIYKLRKDYIYHKNNPRFFSDGIIGDKKEIIKGSDIPNSNKGLEMSIFQWIYIDNIDYKFGKIKHVLTKGNPNLQSREQCPSILLDSRKNDLVIFISTNKKNDRFVIQDYKIRKWFSLGLVVSNMTLDIYLDGELVNSYSLSDSPKINNGDLVLSNNGGYKGMISSIGMFSYALNPNEIKAIHTKGHDNRPLYKRIYYRVKKLFFKVESKVDTIANSTTKK